MMIFQPLTDPSQVKLAERAGLRFGQIGTHTSRTMMLEELRLALDFVPSSGARADYQRAIIDSNCLGKTTAATRRSSFQRLSELYGLDWAVPAFRALRKLWDLDKDVRPQLAVLAAVARDPLLAATSAAVLSLAPGEILPRDAMRGALQNVVGSRLNDAILDKVCRNAASTWTQAGHLEGRTFKRRRLVSASPVSAAYAMYLASVSGVAGVDVFSSPWMRVLDLDPSRARELAFEAKRLGLIDLRIAGDIIELNLARLDPGSARS